MDLAAISKSAAESAITEATFVLGRVLQYDADFGCYECAWLDKSVADNIDTLMKHIEIKRQMAGAEYVNVHITLGMKGGREQIATVKPYQEQRGNRDPLLTERVAALRNFLANYDTDIVTPVANLLQEADDSLTQLQVLRIVSEWYTNGMCPYILQNEEGLDLEEICFEEICQIEDRKLFPTIPLVNPLHCQLA